MLPLLTDRTSVSTVFEEPEDPSNRSFFSEIISSVSDVKFSHSGRYMLTRDYLTVKVWDLNMEARPIETYQVRQGLGSPHMSWGRDHVGHMPGVCSKLGCSSDPARFLFPSHKMLCGVRVIATSPGTMTKF